MLIQGSDIQYKREPQYEFSQKFSHILSLGRVQGGSWIMVVVVLMQRWIVPSTAHTYIHILSGILSAHWRTKWLLTTKEWEVHSKIGNSARLFVPHGMHLVVSVQLQVDKCLQHRNCYQLQSALTHLSTFLDSLIRRESTEWAIRTELLHRYGPAKPGLRHLGTSRKGCVGKFTFSQPEMHVLRKQRTVSSATSMNPVFTDTLLFVVSR